MPESNLARISSSAASSSGKRSWNTDLAIILA
jgi:hypothetical protein